jgi:hypothetical protein
MTALPFASSAAWIISWTGCGERSASPSRAPAGRRRCRLVFTHVFDDRALGAQHGAGWEIYFNRLHSHLAGEFLTEEEAYEAGSTRRSGGACWLPYTRSR